MIHAGVRLVVLSLLTPVGVAAQDPATLRDAFKVKQVVDRMIARYGGEEFLSGIDDVRARLSGPASVRFLDMDPTPSGPPPTITRTLDLTVDRAGDRYVFWAANDNADINGFLNGSNSNFAFVLTPEDRFLYFPKVRMSTHGFAPPTIGRTTMLYLPHLIVADLALDRAAIVWLGSTTLAGRPVDRIHYAPAVSGYRVFLIDEDGYLVGMETPAVDPRRGDVVRSSVISGYEDVNGLAVPGRFKAVLGQDTLYDLAYEAYDLDAAIPDSAFAPPAGYEVFENIPFPGRQMTQLAENVHMFGPTQTLIVELADEVVVFDLPFDDLDRIRALVGDKPIRVAIPSHHHRQHSGGLRSFVHAGIPIMTTSRNREHFEHVATSRSVLNPDAQSREPREPVFEVVDDRRVFDDGTTRLEVINIGPVGHARDLYIAYLPHEEIVFTADLFAITPEAVPLKVSDYYRDLAEANLRAVERAAPGATTVVVGHGSTIPLAELEVLIRGGGR